jgi:hypothetical protein
MNPRTPAPHEPRTPTPLDVSPDENTENDQNTRNEQNTENALRAHG